MPEQLQIALMGVLFLLMLANVIALLLRVMGFRFYPSVRPTKGGIRMQVVPDLLVARGSAEWEVDGKHYRAYRAGAIMGSFLLESGGVVVARAEKASVFRRALTIDYEGAQFTLRPRSFHPLLSSDLELVDEDENLVGSFEREGIFSGPGTADLPRNLPPYIRLFIVWLATMLWRRMHEG